MDRSVKSDQIYSIHGLAFTLLLYYTLIHTFKVNGNLTLLLLIHADGHCLHLPATGESEQTRLIRKTSST